jgi:hypothetical protein
MGWLSFAPSGRAQTALSERRVSVNKKAASIEDVLNELSEDYKLDFSYSRDLVSLQQEITIKVVDRPLKEVLDILFREKGIQYVIVGNQIALRKDGHKHYTINGIIKDSLSGESLIGANVKLFELPKSATSSNTYGFYSISAPSDQYEVVVSYIGYSTLSRIIKLKKNLVMDISLQPDNSLQEVVVTQKSTASGKVFNPQLGVEKLNMQATKDVPIIFGEKDILKTLQLLPGIKSAGEGNSGFYVRGGSSDQNLILLDEAIVYNASHLIGFLSTFNSDAIKDVTVYKGGMPAQYGGRLASALDVRMNEGNQNKKTVEGGIGLISSRLKFEGPIKKGRGSFMLSGRRSYADAILSLFPSQNYFKDPALYFFDFNAKANYKINTNNTFYISSYSGKDHLSFGDNFNLNWGNTTGTMRWNHLFNQRLFLNTTLIYSDYNYIITNVDLAVKQIEDNNKLEIKSIIRDINFKQDYQYFANNRHTLRFGVNAIHHKIHPGRVRLAETSSADEKDLERRKGYELAAYISDERKFKNLTLVYGMRLSSFSLLGPGNFSTYNADGQIINTTNYGSGDFVKSYLSAEPRLSASYRFKDTRSIKASYTRTTQNLHLLSNTTSSLPTDLWVMSSNNTRPQTADQVAFGYFQNFKEDKYELSAEIYYKDMQNQIDYRNAARLKGNENVESELLYGKGRAYGLELFLKKRTGTFNGWIGYTLSRTERKFDAISNGDYFPARQDRTHDLSLVGIYKASSAWTLSGTFVYNTGNAVTFPRGRYIVDGVPAYYYTERNRYRLPSYHRLDLNATWNGKATKKFQSSWTFGVYNAYNRRNAYSIEFTEDSFSRPQALQMSMFGIIPSVTWNFKF